MTKTSLRSSFCVLTLGMALAAVTAPSQAALSLTIPTRALQANAVQAFSEIGLQAFEAVDIVVSPLGNATEVAGVRGAYNLPVTDIQLQLVKVSGGSASGSALEFIRLNDFDELKRLTLSNFKINFNTRQVLADAHEAGGPTHLKAPIFDFRQQTALILRYRFPLSITAHQVLDQLKLTPEAKAIFIRGLELPVFARPILDSVEFGTITVDVAVQPRARPISAKPHIPAP